MRRLLISLSAFVAVVFALLLSARPASAYPWMIRHEYTGCAICHGDPSGGGVLTPYGRAQGDLLLRMHYSQPKPGEETGEASPTAGFLLGLFNTPDWFLPGGAYREALLDTKAAGSPANFSVFEMQADLRAIIRPSFFRAGGSLGFAQTGALPAALTSMPKNNLVAREYWAGVAFKDDTVLIRAGRMNLPFGVRNVDHTLWVRTETRTDINDGQQTGLSLAYNGETLRGELMGIAGNFQIHPDAYRQRGAVGYLEYTVAPKYALGVSGLFTSALLDPQTATTLRRGALGVFGRGSPAKMVVLTTEINALLNAPAGVAVQPGMVGMLQADFEVKQGLHLLGTAEIKDETASGLSTGGWLGAWWFFLPHLDLRVDGIVQNVASPGQHTLVTTLLGQLHAFL